MRHGSTSEILFFLSTFFLSGFRNQAAVRLQSAERNNEDSKKGINIQGFGCGENAISGLRATSRAAFCGMSWLG
jgi:hypothetical protein